MWVGGWVGGSTIEPEPMPLHEPFRMKLATAASSVGKHASTSFSPMVSMIKLSLPCQMAPMMALVISMAEMSRLIGEGFKLTAGEPAFTALIFAAAGEPAVESWIAAAAEPAVEYWIALTSALR